MLTQGGSRIRVRLIAIGTGLAAALAVGVGVSAPAHAETWNQEATFAAHYATGVAVTSDGATAVVTDADGTSLTIINVAAETTQTVDVGLKTAAVKIDSANAYAYIVSVDTAEILRLTLSDLSFSLVSVSTQPRYLLFDTSGNYLYVQGAVATDRITLADFTVTLDFLSGVVPGPIAQTAAGAIWVEGTTAVQHFDQSGSLIETFARTGGVLGAATLSPDDNYLIGINDNGHAYRTNLTTGVTALWRSDLGWGASYHDILVIGDYGYTTGLLGQLVTKFSLVDSSTPSTVLLSFQTAGYPRDLAAPADGSYFLLTLPGFGQVMKFGVATPPDTPAAPSAVAGDGEATVTASGAGTGSPATSLTVTASPGDATCQINAASGECTVSGLENGTAYTFTVVATNTSGDSEPSPASAAVTPQAAGSAPSASAVRVTGSTIEGSTLTATISDLAGSGTVERVWTWQRKKGNSVWVDIANANAATYVIKAADIGAVLRARVALSNDLGDVTVASNPTAVVLSKAVKPAPPGSVKAAVKAKTAKTWTITVSWAKVASPVDDPITAYAVTCKAGKVKLTGSVKGAATSVALVATQQGTYSCTVTDTRRRGGTSNPSTAVKAVVK